ncbi:UNVERIFIED_CONTAM: hypothetical protein POZ17_11635 [Ralstonia mannitolilytica]
MKSKPITTLLYEDTPDYVNSFKTSAQAKRILVKSIDNVEELTQEMSTNLRKYSFLVLDARAFLKPGQLKGTESELNLFKIFDYIKDLNRQGIYLPYCINTGFADIKTQLNNYDVPCEIFEKGNEDKLFDFIWSTHNNSDVGKLLVSFPAIFELAQRMFDDTNFELLKELYSRDNYNLPGITERVKNLQTIRKTSEHLFDLVYSNYLGGLGGIINSNGSRFSDITNYLFQQKDLPIHLNSFLITLRKTCSEYGAHNPQAAASIQDYPSNNFITSLSIGLIDIYEWAKMKI